MASVIKQTIIDMMNQAKTITDLSLYPLQVAVWNNQIQRMIDGTGETMPQPALYIEMVYQDWQMLALGIKTNDIIWRLHICHRQEDAGDGTMDQNLDVFDLRDQVLDKFTLFKPTNSGSLNYYEEEQDFEHTNIYHYIVSFMGIYTETKGSPLDPTDGDWIVKEGPTDLCVTYEENKDKGIFTPEFTPEFE